MLGPEGPGPVGRDDSASGAVEFPDASVRFGPADAEDDGLAADLTVGGRSCKSAVEVEGGLLAAARRGVVA